MGIKNHLRTMFAILTLICVLISTTGLAACTCQDDCQTDRNTCENGCDTTWDSCYDTCSDQRISCDTTCDNNYNSCMSGCGGDPGCEGDCEMERMMCQDTCSWNEGECMNWCNDDQSDCYSGCGSTYDACIAACPPPPSITHTKGRYWVNHTWVLNCTDESVPTSYNVSINQTWHNGTATKWYNNSGLQGGVWSNAVVLAWNATSGTICSVTLSENVYLPLPLPPAPVGTGSTWDFFWVNHTWSVGSDGEWAGDTDSFNVSIETHWVNGTTKNEWVNGSLTTFYNNSLDGEYGWSNITVWSYNSTGGLSSTYIYQNVEVPIFVPPTPVNPQSTSGRFWVNHTWSPGTGHHTDSYNVSLESDGWHNGTLTAYYKEPMSSNGWSNITVYAYNNTHHKLSESALTQNVLISWANDIFVNTSGWWRDGDTFHATAEPFSRATDNVVTGESIRVYDGTYYEAAWIFADNVTITPVSGRPIIHPSTQQGTLTIAGDNISVSGFMFKTPLQWVIGDGYCLLFYGTEGSTSSNNDFQVRRTSLAPVTAIKVINSGNCTISGGEIEVAQERGIYIDALSSGTTVTGTTIHSYYGCSPEYGLSITRSMMSDYYRQHNTITGNSMWNVGTGIAIVIVVTPGETLDVRATFDETNVVSGNSITGSNIGIKLNASGVTTAGGVLTHDGWITGDMTGNSVSSCTYGVKHLLSSITWNGSASSNTHDHYFSGDTSGSVILDPPSLANLYLADTASTCTITNTDGRMFDVCGTRHEYIDALAYAYPNGTFSRYISDSSPLQALNLLFYNDFTITPTSAPVSVSNIEFFGSACDATGGHDVEVDVASSTPANEVRFNITGDSTWINDYVDMDISGTFVKREKANIAGFVSILYTGGFSSHHFEFDEIYVPAGGGGANPFTDYSFECRAEDGWDPYETTFCNWSQSKSCFGTAGGCSGGEGECGWVECGLTSESSGGVCRTGSWHTDGDYSAWIIATINCYDACEWNNDCAVTTTVYQSVDLTGIDTISFDARFREHANLVVSDCEEPGTAAIDFQQAIDMYVDGTRVWRECYGSFWWGASEGWTGWDHIEEHLDQEADVSAYTSTHDIKLVAYIAFQGTTDFATIDGWMQMQGFFDNMGVTYSVQPPGNLLYDACPYYVNHTWDTPTDGAVIDSYNVSMNSIWHNGTTDPFYKDTSLTDWWQWSNISVHSYNATEGLSPANSSATVQLIPAIPVPADLSHTEGHIWIRHTWAPGSSFSCLCTPTQSYNVSVNDVWYNGTTDLFYDDPGLAYEEWSNITVYSYSSDAGIISNVPVTQNLKVDSPKPATPVGGTGEWGFFWVNHSWSAGSGPENSDTDSYNYSVTTHLIGGSPSTIWYNDSTNTSHNNSLGTHGWSNITVYAWNDNVTAGLSENAIYQDIEVLKYTPPNPLNIDHTYGIYWVNHTWQVGSGKVTDSYNVSINGLWHNNTLTTYFNDTTVVACGWSNIIVWAWNNTEGGLSEGNVSQDVTLPEGHPAVPNSTDSTWGFYWVNHTWKEGDSYGEWCAATDAYNYSVTTHLIGGSPSTIWYNDSTNTSHNNSMGDFGWSNLSVWAWNGTGGLCGLSIAPIYQNTEVIQYTPPTPTYIHNETDPNAQVWANYSWACDEGGRGLADSFNISINEAWHNGTTLCDNNQPVPEDSDFEDNTLMGWTTSGSYAWTSTAYGYESTYAIRDGFTGTATGSSTAWKIITLNDYGTLYFDCKTNGGTLTVYNGSETLYEITGTHDWQSIRINLTAGTRTIKFTYTRPASPTPENHVWVDNVAVRQRVNGWYIASGIVDDDLDIVVWAWNDTCGGISEGYTNDSVYIGRIPRTPANINHTTGWYWVNYTWEEVDGHDDSYNVSLNGVWHNDTLNRFCNDSGRMTDWGQCSEIAHVYSYNTTLGTLSNSSISDSACLAPTLTLWNDYTDGSHTIIETFDQLFTIEFTCSSDAEMATWDWTGEDSNGGITNSKTTNGTLFVYEWKTYTITVKGKNATGVETAKHTWTVTLVPADDWYDPNYAFRKKVLVNVTCDTGHWWDQIHGYHIPVHLDTTLCAWTDCWDIFCYAPIMTQYTPRRGLNWYTPRSQGYPERTTNEEIYVELDFVAGWGMTLISPPWDLWIYYHNPSRTDKADYRAQNKRHCKGYGEILHTNSTLTYRTVGGNSEYWRSMYAVHANVEYSIPDKDICSIYMSNNYNNGHWYWEGRVDLASTYAWYDDYSRIPYVLTQPGNNSLNVSSTVTYSSGYYGVSSHCLELTLVDDPRKTSVPDYRPWHHGYECRYLERNTPSGTLTSTTSTLPLTCHWGGCYGATPVYGTTAGGAWGVFLRGMSSGDWRGRSSWDLSKCDLTYISEPGPIDSETCITVDDNSSQLGLPSPAIVVYDEKGNLVSGLTYMIYDKDNAEVYSPWAVDGDGVIYFNDPSNRNVTLAVRTHEGVYTQDIPLTNGSIINMTIPITYNINIRAFDEGGRQLDETVCTLSEYTIRDPGFFWGLAMGNRTSVRMRDLSSFGMCDMTVEKAGYEQYNATNMTWTTQSTMISDYKQDVTLEAE